MAIDFLPPPEPVATGLQFRELTQEEINSVENVFRATGNPLPDPAISTFVGAVEDGQVLAFLVLQIKLHAQPMWIAEGHSELFSRLVATAEDTILRKAGPSWVYLFVPSGSRLEETALAVGMAKEPWGVMSKLVTARRPVLEIFPDPVADQIPDQEPDSDEEPAPEDPIEQELVTQ